MLVDFWLENFKVQVEARSGQLVLETEGMIKESLRTRGLADLTTCHQGSRQENADALEEAA